MPPYTYNNMGSLPADFVDITTAMQAPDFNTVNIIGVVMDVMPPTITKKSEHMFTFKLSDARLFDSGIAGEGLKVRFFAPKIDNLPKIRDIGDVVLLRAVKMVTVNGERVALSGWTTGVLVFPFAAIPTPGFSITMMDKNRIECLGVPLQVSKLNLAEQSYVVNLKDKMGIAIEDGRHRARLSLQRQAEAMGDPTAGPPAKKQKMGNSIGPKFKLVKDLQDRGYADVVGLVIKRIGAQYGCDLYFTDYTSNELLRPYPAPEEEQIDLERDGDAFGYSKGSKKPWPGPFGKTVLKVNIKPPHADFALKSVNEGDLILLRNLKTRITTWGDRGMFLEGDMWPDYQSQNQVNIRKNVDKQSEEVQALMKRKEQYWKAREEKSAKQASLAENADSNKPQTKAERKAAKKARIKERKREEREAAVESNSKASANTSAAADQNGARKNPHVRCSYEEVPISQIRAILDPENALHEHTPRSGNPYALPFHNARYRAKVRVVDYGPKELEDFAVPVLSEEDDTKSIDSMAWQYDDGTPRYEWHFSLLLEDATSNTKPASSSDKLWVEVHHEQAQFLFGNSIDDPEDLRHNPRLLARLREKMFVLWGNLEEKRKEEEVKNLPFECCIMEYGVQLDREDLESPGATEFERWKRMHALFGATIL